ncbi:MAG TPA: efflux RND transporter periplasmic adaptor subunit [Rhizomicrobium sp.]|jgi:RND family efflux transporter MFP subunit|nr:efflux RND transporter periplasmic adaptor subunit [Rhizomicrobium sp.]
MTKVRLSLAAVALIATTPSLAQQTPSVPSVGVATAKVVHMAPKMALPGSVVARNDSHLASEVEGRVSWVAEVGSAVKQNDVVAKIDSDVIGMQLASDKANVMRLSAQLNYDREQAARMQNLFNQQAIAHSTRDQAVSTRDMDAAALAQAQASLHHSQYQFAHSQIRAPFAGRVAARLINVGEYATVGKDIVRLVELNAMEVSAQIPIDSSRYLHEGMPLTVMVGGKAVPSTLRAIVPVGDIASRTIEVRVTLPDGVAYVGDAAKVLVPESQARDVLAVPRDALVLREDNTYIFTVDAKDKAQRIAVETGTEDGTLVEVKGLVRAGSRVIVRGAERLDPGQKVHPVMVT